MRIPHPPPKMLSLASARAPAFLQSGRDLVVPGAGRIAWAAFRNATWRTWRRTGRCLTLLATTGGHAKAQAKQFPHYTERKRSAFPPNRTSKRYSRVWECSLETDVEHPVWWAPRTADWLPRRGSSQASPMPCGERARSSKVCQMRDRQESALANQFRQPCWRRHPSHKTCDARRSNPG